MPAPNPWTRRDFLRITGALGAAAALSACASEEENPTEKGSNAGGAPKEVFNEPATKLSGTLTLLLWSHFVPSHDVWFDKFCKDWGEKVGVDVRVDHVDVGNVPTQIASELQAGQGHDLMQYIATLSQFEPSVLDLADVNQEANKRYGEQLKICTDSSYNPHTKKYYAFAPGWVPDPGNYRKSLWEPAGFADGPSSWDELLEAGTKIKQDQGVALGLGMSQEIDSNMAGHALLWSYGASVQDENEQVVLNSPQTLEAVDLMSRLFKGAMTDEVFAWNAASNNEGLISGKLSYILNSISAYRSSQDVNPEVAGDTFFVKALQGSQTGLAAQHVMYNYIVPSKAGNPDAAKEFLLHLADNFALATYHSKLYDFPSWPSLAPKLGDWLAKDPFGSKPSDKLAFLGDVNTAAEWSASIGHPGPSSPAIGEIIGTFVIPNMFARAVRGNQSPQAAVERAQRECERIFSNWRERGLVGGA